MLIPFYQTKIGNGGVGAAIATAVTELYIMIALFSLVPKGYLQAFRLGVFIKSSVAGGIMLLTILLLKSIVTWTLLALTSALVFGLVIFLLKTFEIKEMEFIRNILGTYRLRDAKNFLTDDRSSLE